MERPDSSSTHNVSTNPWLREAELLKEGFAGFSDAAKSDLSWDKLPETEVKVLAGAAIGLTVARFAPSWGLLGSVSKTAATAGTLSFGLDVLTNANTVGDAMLDTFESGKNWKQNAEVMRRSGGQFVFDTALMTAAGAPLAEHFSPKWLPEEAFPNQGLAARAGQFVPGENITDWVRCGRSYRQSIVHISENYKSSTPAPLVVALDGVLTAPKNPIYGMSEVNGITAQSDKLGFTTLYALPKRRFFGQVLTWNEPDGAVNFFGARNYSDTEYIQKAMERITNHLQVDADKRFGVAFSQGGLQLHKHVAESEPNTFSAIASVHGTMMDKVPPAPAGTRLLVIHSQGDKTLPWNGGTGGLTKLLEGLGWTNVRQSKPSAQVGRYLEANNINSAPHIEQTSELVNRSWYLSESDTKPFVQEIVLNEKYGHGFPGRPVGGNNESKVSKLNGRVADASVLDAKRLIFEDFFGLKSPEHNN